MWNCWTRKRLFDGIREANNLLVSNSVLSLKKTILSSLRKGCWFSCWGRTAVRWKSIKETRVLKWSKARLGNMVGSITSHFQTAITLTLSAHCTLQDKRVNKETALSQTILLSKLFYFTNCGLRQQAGSSIPSLHIMDFAFSLGLGFFSRG